MKIAVLIPDRGDRPKLMQNCLRMMNAQTLKPTVVFPVNYTPEGNAIDITQRYRRGYKSLSGHGFDLIALVENDDWYSPNYLEYMATEWDKAGRPNIFGTNYTIYYHLKLRRYFVFEHFDRASAMNTFLRPDLDIKWPVDHDPYTDLHLWRDIPGKVIKPAYHISMGMKHGEGLSGGQFHTDELYRFDIPDQGFLESIIGLHDPDSFQFYSQYFHNQ